MFTVYTLIFTVYCGCLPVLLLIVISCLLPETWITKHETIDYTASQSRLVLVLSFLLTLSILQIFAVTATRYVAIDTVSSLEKT